MMKITSIRLKKVRCFKEITVDLCEEGHACSALIAGNNGSGKSAVLRSIAMGLCDQASSGALLRELPGDFVRSSGKNSNRTAEIEVSLQDCDQGESFRLNTEISSSKKLGFETVKLTILDSKNKEIPQEKFEWGKIFVAAYGAGIRTEGTEDYVQYFSADAVYSLFKYSQTLQNPELVWRRLLDASGDIGSEATQNDKIPAVLASILDLDSEASTTESNATTDAVSLENNGIFIKGKGWEPQELSAVGDGYRALTTMVVDLLGWQLLAQNNETILDETSEHASSAWTPLDWRNLKGIVIIDELEKHLHPRLQRKVISRLAKIFPEVQFIISTHSPLCVSGAADVEGNGFKILKSFRNEKGEQKIEKNSVPVGYRADQVLVDYFDLETTVSPEFEKKVNELRRLSLKRATEKLGKEEARRLEKLSRELEKNAPLLYEREQDREIELRTEKYHKKLIKLLEKVDAEDD